MDHPEGAGSGRGGRVDFDPCVRPEFRGTQFGSDGGLPVMRELDDAPGLSDPVLRDSRQGRNTVRRLDGLVRQAVHGRLAGYGDSTFGKTCIPRRCLKSGISTRRGYSLYQVLVHDAVALRGDLDST